MYRDFGAKLPMPTQFVLDTWPAWIAVGAAIPIIAWVCARKAAPDAAILLSLLLGFLMFLIAQGLTAALFLPVSHLSSIAVSPR